MSSNKMFDKLSDNEKLTTGLFVCSGGFEDRSKSFPNRLKTHACDIESSAIIHYDSQQDDNQPNFDHVYHILRKATRQQPKIVHVDALNPVISYEHIKKYVFQASKKISLRRATIDISGMTHMWALGVIHACVMEGFEVDIIYTEARSYFPLKSQAEPLLNAWQDRNYEEAQKFLQSAALRDIHILPDFVGNFRPGHPTCLLIFAGYEPNRLEGLVDSYAPGTLVVFYGKSPRPEHEWRTELSQKLHQEMFANWPRRNEFCSTLDPEKALLKLEEIFSVVGVKYDIAVSPHCSKMQGVASYVFWRRHPETQLIFTSPARFKPSQYSKGERDIYVYRLTTALNL